MRPDKRRANQLRPVKVKTGYLKYAMGSCMIEMGNTRVLCSASVDENVPGWMRGKGRGWVTSEYGMLPASCNQRIMRESTKGKASGRTQEIQRLIGRSLRAVVDLNLLGERTVWIDADVIQGDGGTRTAAITGCYIALSQAVSKLLKSGAIKKSPLKDSVAAVSVGIVKGVPVLDLCYEEDSTAEVDMNIVMTGTGKFVEIQGTAEGEPFSQKEISAMMTLAKKGIRNLSVIQKKHTKGNP